MDWSVFHNRRMGYVRLKRGTYLIEPARRNRREDEEEGRPHVVHKENGGTARARGSNDRPELHLETLLVLDKTMTDSQPPDQLENYVLSIFNIAYDLFNDASLDNSLNLELVRLISLEHEDDDMNLAVNKDMYKTLEAFSEWQEGVNPSDDSHPNHHDVAALIAKAGPWKRDEARSCGSLGGANQGSACNPKRQAALALDTGLATGYVLAHQLAHTLGVDHDVGKANGSCDPFLEDGSSTVMNPEITSRAAEWSECSRRAIASFLGDKGSCLADEPAEHNFNIPQILPGVLYGADYQCKQLIGPRARECSEGSTCDSLNCQVDNSRCMKTGVPPAAGTNCGEKKWCYAEECVEEGARPNKGVEGSWESWSGWSTCSRSCGSGVATSRRRCTTRHCPGQQYRHRICAAQPCKIGSPSFRNVQCSEFNSMVLPEDNSTHTWKAIQIHGENPCELICINENGVVASLKAKVTDGTTCFRGIRDICIAGECKAIPCDFKMESHAIEDVCGLCHGNGADCKLVEGMKKYNQTGIHPIVKVPPGTKNVKVEETGPTNSRIIIRSMNGNEVLNDGKKLGMFFVLGSNAWLGLKKPHQQEMIIPGPLKEGLKIMVKNSSPVSVKYSMGVPIGDKSRKTSYNWDYVDWTECSAQCGPGTEYSNPKCTERIGGLVEDRYCAGEEKPPSRTRPCNLAPCTPRWILGEWHECGPCPSENAKHFRSVNCKIPLGEGEGKSKFVDDSLCPRPKPISSESCSCRNKRQFDYRILSNPTTGKEQDALHSLQFYQMNPHSDVQFSPTMKSEKKVTLMQLENESEESLSRQYKENELKKKLPFVVMKGQNYFPAEVLKSLNLTRSGKMFKRNLNASGRYKSNNKSEINKNDSEIGNDFNEKFSNISTQDFSLGSDNAEESTLSIFQKLKNYKIGSSPLEPQLFHLFSTSDNESLLDPTVIPELTQSNNKIHNLQSSSSLNKAGINNNENKVDLIINLLKLLVENQIISGTKQFESAINRYSELVNYNGIKNDNPYKHFPFQEEEERNNHNTKNKLFPLSLDSDLINDILSKDKIRILQPGNKESSNWKGTGIPDQNMEYANDQVVNKREIQKKNTLKNEHTKRNVTQLNSFNKNNNEKKYHKNLNKTVNSIKKKLYVLYQYIKQHEEKQNNEVSEDKCTEGQSTTEEALNKVQSTTFSTLCDSKNESEETTILQTEFPGCYAEDQTSTTCRTTEEVSECVTDETDKLTAENIHTQSKRKVDTSLTEKHNHASLIKKRNVLSLLPVIPDKMIKSNITNRMNLLHKYEEYVQSQPFSKIDEKLNTLLIPEIVLHPENVELTRIVGKLKHRESLPQNTYKLKSERKLLKLNKNVIKDPMNKQKYELYIPNKPMEKKVIPVVQDNSKIKRNTISKFPRRNNKYHRKIKTAKLTKNKVDKVKEPDRKNSNSKFGSGRIIYNTVIPSIYTGGIQSNRERQERNCECDKNKQKLKQILDIAKKQRHRTEHINDKYNMKHEQIFAEYND